MNPTRSPGFPVFAAAAAIHAWLVGPAQALRDSGEIGAAAQVLGVAHPTGFPLDLLLLRAATLLPVGTVAFRQNLAVGLVSAAVLGVVAHVVHLLARRAGADPGPARVGAVVGATLLGAFPIFLGTGLVVEVYSTALLLVGLGGAEALRERPRPAWLGLLFGLSLGAHVAARAPLLVLALSAFLAASPPGRRALGLALGALLGGPVVAYLPLASLRDPPLDWGDPETLSRLLDHLSAERIRTAFSGQMGAGGDGVAPFVEQLAALGPAWLFVALGAWALFRPSPRPLLVLLVLGAGDFAYATWVNPMGIADLQVGHLVAACASVLAGTGVAAAVTRVPPRLASIGVAAAALLAAASVLRAPPPPGLDRVGDELLGDGGALALAPSRAILVCSSDDVCAAALFARYAEGTRPDVVVLVGQHLWEPVERRKLLGVLPREILAAPRPGGAAARGELAAVALGALTMDSGGRPLRFESAPGTPVALSEMPGWLAPAGQGQASPRASLAALEAMARARAEGGSLAATEWGRAEWSRAYEREGRGALAMGAPAWAAAAFRRSVAEAPTRAVAWTNLGVALAGAGDLPGAIRAAEQGVRLEPSRATAWANLARYLAASGDLPAARRALEAAAASGVRDPRLDALRVELAPR